MSTQIIVHVFWCKKIIKPIKYSDLRQLVKPKQNKTKESWLMGRITKLFFWSWKGTAPLRNMKTYENLTTQTGIHISPRGVYTASSGCSYFPKCSKTGHINETISLIWARYYSIGWLFYLPLGKRICYTIISKLYLNEFRPKAIHSRDYANKKHKERNLKKSSTKVAIQNYFDKDYYLR